MTDTLDAEGLYKSDTGLMRTFTDRKVNPLTMTYADVDITDVAVSLSNQCRYNGHVAGFLSVARHSVWVAEHLAEIGADVQTQLCGLLHDAAEAYLGDMIRPLKHGPTGEVYREAEARLEGEIARAFDLPWPFDPAIAEADTHVCLVKEIHAERWGWTSTPAQDRADFLDLFVKLTTVDDGTETVERESVLAEANRLINGDRNAAYDHPSVDYGRTVAMFNAWRGVDAGELTVEDGVAFMVFVKLSRERHRHKRDNLVDGAGYLGCWAKVIGEDA